MIESSKAPHNHQRPTSPSLNVPPHLQKSNRHHDSTFRQYKSFSYNRNDLHSGTALNRWSTYDSRTCNWFYLRHGLYTRSSVTSTLSSTPHVFRSFPQTAHWAPPENLQVSYLLQVLSTTSRFLYHFCLCFRLCAPICGVLRAPLISPTTKILTKKLIARLSLSELKGGIN